MRYVVKGVSTGLPGVTLWKVYDTQSRVYVVESTQGLRDAQTRADNFNGKR